MRRHIHWKNDPLSFPFFSPVQQKNLHFRCGNFYCQNQAPAKRSLLTFYLACGPLCSHAARPSSVEGDLSQQSLSQTLENTCSFLASRMDFYTPIPSLSHCRGGVLDRSGERADKRECFGSLRPAFFKSAFSSTVFDPLPLTQGSAHLRLGGL